MPVSQGALNCDRPLGSVLRARETVMSMGGQITDSVRPRAPHPSLWHKNDLARKVGRLWAAQYCQG